MIILWTAVSLAQTSPSGLVDVPALNAQRYRPPIDAVQTLWADDSGAIVDGLRPGARLLTHYVNDPFVVYWDPPAGGKTQRTELVGGAWQLDAIGSVAYDRLRLGIDVPIYLLSQGDLTANGAGLGDLRADLRGTLLDKRDKPIGLALAARLELPTTTVDAPLGSGKAAWELSAIVDKRIDKLLLAANVGTRGLPRQEMSNMIWGDQLLFRVGGGYAFSPATNASLDLSGDFTYAMLSSGSTDLPAGGAAVPVELLAGIDQRIQGDWYAQLGAGSGLSPGIGSPTFRALLGISYRAPLGPLDADGDGIVDKSDACPDLPEDADGYQDSDGCPDPDNDADGILDTDDDCPLEPEDVDDWDDADGCPDPARAVLVRMVNPDGRLIPNATAELAEAQDRARASVSGEQLLDLHPSSYSLLVLAEGYEPTDTNFEVTLSDNPEPQQVIVTLTPMVPTGSVRLTVVDPDGNPLPNTTAYFDDGAPLDVTDGAFEGTLVARSYDVTVGAGPNWERKRASFKVRKDRLTQVKIVLTKSKARIEGDRIVIGDSVYFNSGSSVIQRKSWDLLDEVALILLEHPEAELVRIEGHTDAAGGAASNLSLSKRRAAAVLTYLVELGVPKAQLKSEGYGEERPIDPADTKEAYSKNRRVDFFVEKWAEGH